jgi:hypothetical protein
MDLIASLSDTHIHFAAIGVSFGTQLLSAQQISPRTQASSVKIYVLALVEGRRISHSLMDREIMLEKRCHMLS